MAEEAARPEQAVALVDVEIVARLGVERGGEGDLVAVLREVGLHIGVRVLGRQRLRHLHLRRRRGDGEARRHRDMRPALPVPGGDHRLGVVVARLRRVGDAVRRVAVHHHLAADHAHVAPRRLREEGLRRGAVHRAVGDGGGGAVAEELVEEAPGDAGGVLGVGELRLGGEGVGVQPVEQLRAPGADHLHLRHVDVGVDEARHQKMRAVVVHRRAGPRLGRDLGRRTHRGDQPVADEDGAVRVVGVGGVVVDRLPARRETAARVHAAVVRSSAGSPHRLAPPSQKIVPLEIRRNPRSDLTQL